MYVCMIYTYIHIGYKLVSLHILKKQMIISSSQYDFLPGSSYENVVDQRRNTINASPPKSYYKIADTFRKQND